MQMAEWRVNVYDREFCELTPICVVVVVGSELAGFHCHAHKLPKFLPMRHPTIITVTFFGRGRWLAGKAGRQ